MVYLLQLGEPPIAISKFVCRKIKKKLRTPEIDVWLVWRHRMSCENEESILTRKPFINWPKNFKNVKFFPSLSDKSNLWLHLSNQYLDTVCFTDLGKYTLVKFRNSGWLYVGSSQFLLLHQLPQYLAFEAKTVKNYSNICISISLSKSVAYKIELWSQLNIALWQPGAFIEVKIQKFSQCLFSSINQVIT